MLIFKHIIKRFHFMGTSKFSTREPYYEVSINTIGIWPISNLRCRCAKCELRVEIGADKRICISLE